MSIETFKKIDNPYIVGNPVKSKNMFFGRDETFRSIKNTIVSDESHVILLVGGRRSGKTSILMQIKEGRIKKDCESIFCDFHEIVAKIKEDEDLPRLIGECILKNPQFKEFKTYFYDSPFNHSGYGDRLQVLIDASIKKIKPKKLVFLCDEFDNLEKLFEKGDLSKHAMIWVKSILTKNVFFIMTSSQSLRNNYVREVFSYDSIENNININFLSEKETFDLITCPVENYLQYDQASLKEIYRLSGGQPYFTQYICQILITDVNYSLKRDYIIPEDLHAVIKSFIDHPPGHMIEIWHYLSDPRNAPPYSPYVLTALATTIKNKEHYIDIKSLLKIGKEKKFIFNELELRESLAWLKSYYLLDWKRENYRFKFDLLRHWVSSYYESGEDVSSFLKSHIEKNLEKEYAKKVHYILKQKKYNGNITGSNRKEIITLYKNFRLSKKIAISIVNNENKKLLSPIGDVIINVIFHPSSSLKKGKILSLIFSIFLFLLFLIYW